MGTLNDRVHREFTNSDFGKIVSAYHTWRSDGWASLPASRDGDSEDGSAGACPPRPPAGDRRALPSRFANVAGFCKSGVYDFLCKA